MENRLFVVYETPDNEIVLLTCEKAKPSVRDSSHHPTPEFVDEVLMKSYDLQRFGREDLLKGHVRYRERGSYIQHIK